MGFDIIPGDIDIDIDAEDLNPLHWINKANHAFGNTLASGLEFLGITDPAVDPDGIREMAKQWRALAKGLDAAARDAETALKDLEWEGEAAKALHKRAKTARTQATEMADSLRKGAKALDDFADEAHALLTEIGVILAEIAEFEIAGLALSVLTGGLSAIAGSLAAGARAAKVVALIARIEKSGSRMARVIRTVMEAIRGLERALKALGEIKTIARAGKMAGEGMKFSAFDAALQDPGTFKDPDKLAGLLAEGVVLGIGGGMLGKALGKGLKKLKPSELARLGRSLGIGGSDVTRLKLKPGEAERLTAGIRAAEKELKVDPIDVATGDMFLAQTDVQLPGALPLILERTHLSSYRWGGWFGPSWASTLDQRLQASDDGITYATADGARLTYPLLDAAAEAPVYAGPVKSLPLSWDTETDGALRVTDPASGLAYVFHSPRPTDDGEAVDLPLQAIVDNNGQRITVQYTDDGTPTGLVHSGGYRIALDQHPTLPRISALRLLDPENPGGRGTTLVSFGYGDDGNLTEVINSSGLPTRFTYDEADRITSWTDRNGSAYQYFYDDHGRVVRTDGSGGFLAGTLTYDDATRTTTVTSSLGHTTRYEHDEAHRLVRETDPLGHTRHQEWNAHHQLVAVTDAQGHTARYEYDEHGQVTSVIRPDGSETRSTYNEFGLPTALTGPDGAAWHQEYDARGNLTAMVDPVGAITQFTYNGAGQRKSVTDPLGDTTHLRCDRVGLPRELIDPLGAVTHYERDAFGRTSAITDPLGNVTRFEWTVEGKLVCRTAPDGTSESWQYDGEGNCTAHTTPGGGVTRFEYTHFDLVAARTDPDGSRYEFTYDTDLRLISVTNPQNRSWTYSYDAAGRLAAETDFDGRRWEYSYSPAGHLTSRTNAMGQITRFEHDALGRVVRKDADGAVTTFEYDHTGLLVRAANADVSIELEHDAAGRVRSESVNDHTIRYVYDPVGRRTSRTTPSGVTSEWAYDRAGRPTVLLTGSGHAIATDYDTAGGVAGRHVDGIATLTQTLDQLGRLTDQSVIAPGGLTVQNRTYEYGSDGSPRRIGDRLNGARHFDVDGAGRVTAVQAHEWSERYAYDELGNQTEAAWPSAHPQQEATGTRTYQGTLVTRAGAVRYEYDAQGRVVLRQKTRLSRKPDTWRYAWDAEDRLVSVTTPDGTTWRYLYDPFGRRIAKQRLAADGASVTERTDFAWDGTTLCEQSTSSVDLPASVIVTWDHDGTRPLAQTERSVTPDAPQGQVDARFYAIVTDLVGTPTELLGEDGDIAWRARSTLWGVTAWSTQSTTYTPLRFPGQYYDPESGLHYNYFRHYDPETARYLSQDPLGLAPADNPRMYTANPNVWTDILGLAPGTCPATGQQIDPKGYSSLFEMQLDPADFGRGRGVHFNRANTALDDAIKADPELGAYLDQFSPGIADRVSSTGGRRDPIGHTWQHEPAANAGGRQGVIRLVPRYQHTPGSPWWDVLHPGNSGGYAEWAIPNGAPPNYRRRR